MLSSPCCDLFMKETARSGALSRSKVKAIVLPKGIYLECNQKSLCMDVTPINSTTDCDQHLQAQNVENQYCFEQRRIHAILPLKPMKQALSMKRQDFDVSRLLANLLLHRRPDAGYLVVI